MIILIQRKNPSNIIFILYIKRNSLCIGGIAELFIFLLEIKEIDYLYKNSEEDDCYNSSQEHVLYVAVCEQETK